MSDTAHPTLKLTVALTATWLVLAGPAFLLGGSTAVEGLAWAAGLCFLPHLLTLAVQFVVQPGNALLVNVLLSVTLRLLVVLAGVVMIWSQRPEFRSLSFVLWLAPCYLVALAVETRQVIAQANASQPEPPRDLPVTRTALGG